MRIIKFRAWDKKEKRMYGVDELTSTGGIGLMPMEGMSTVQGFKRTVLGEVELMQFTGLKDNSGKEIWEGDIINFGGQNRVVEYKDDGFFWGTEHLLITLVLPKSGEVIGNIYENHELLKGNQ